MITYLQAVILGALQGATELFPVSSLGHSVILPSLLGWNIDQSANSFLLFLVATHLATSLVLLAFFFKDWVLIVTGMWRSLKQRRIDSSDVYARLGWLIVVGTIPAGIVGILFEKTIQSFLAAPIFAAAFLTVNGFMLWGMEWYKQSQTKDDLRDAKFAPEVIGTSDVRISTLSWSETVKIGCAQVLALIPGISRTGSTLGGGLMVGLSHEDAARFSFLLATPIIFAAAVLKLPDLAVGTSAQGNIGALVVGAVTSAIAAYFSVRFLSRYFKSNKLTPFAIYCIVAGLFSLIVLGGHS